MGTYLFRRILQMILILIIVSAVVFLLVRLLPGDPILMYLTRQDVEGISPETVAKMRHELGLDRPIYVQCVDWVAHVVTGDLGNSLVQRRPVISDIKQRMPITIHLGLSAFFIAVLLGIPFGVIAAVRRGGWLDQVITTFGNLGITVPIFLLGILLIYLFGLRLGWLPIYGYTSPFEDFWLNAKQIIMPVFCLAIPPITATLRLTRSGMLEVMRQDYIRTAWLKG
jgi:peptide/nickel transport system permease protein